MPRLRRAKLSPGGGHPERARASRGTCIRLSQKRLREEGVHRIATESVTRRSSARSNLATRSLVRDRPLRAINTGARRVVVRNLGASGLRARSPAVLRSPERNLANKSSRGRSSRATSNAQTSPFAAGELREASANGRSVTEKISFVPLTVPTGQRLFAQGK